MSVDLYILIKKRIIELEEEYATATVVQKRIQLKTAIDNNKKLLPPTLHKPVRTLY